MQLIKTSIFILVIIFYSCKGDINEFDATGTFEATEVIVSSEVNGKILDFESEEGAALKANQSVLQIDALDFELEKHKLQAQIEALAQKQLEYGPQVDVLKKQLESARAQTDTHRKQMEVLRIEQKRINNLFDAKAATKQQLDDINGKIDVQQKLIEASETQWSVINAQIDAARRNVAIQNRGINSERDPMLKQMDLIESRLQKAKVLSPIAGTLISKYIEKGEYATLGKPLFKVANLEDMTLRAFITGDQIVEIKIGQDVDVFIDKGDDEFKSYPGTVQWISDKAEFTPKTIQTKDERANLVYATKISVKNDGYLKIGMYGEVKFKSTDGDDE